MLFIVGFYLFSNNDHQTKAEIKGKSKGDWSEINPPVGIPLNSSEGERRRMQIGVKAKVFTPFTVELYKYRSLGLNRSGRLPKGAFGSLQLQEKTENSDVRLLLK